MEHGERFVRSDTNSVTGLGVQLGSTPSKSKLRTLPARTETQTETQIKTQIDAQLGTQTETQIKTQTESLGLEPVDYCQAV